MNVGCLTVGEAGVAQISQETRHEWRVTSICHGRLVLRFVLRFPNGNPFSFERATGELSMTKSHLLIGAAAFAVAISVSQPALAQDTAAECLDADNNGVCDSDESTERSIVVTGSSIARSEEHTSELQSIMRTSYT